MQARQNPDGTQNFASLTAKASRLVATAVSQLIGQAAVHYQTNEGREGTIQKGVAAIAARFHKTVFTNPILFFLVTFSQVLNWPPPRKDSSAVLRQRRILLREEEDREGAPGKVP